MHDRSEWIKGTAGEVTLTVRGKNRTYKNLTPFSRPCAACGEMFSIHVTEKIAAGHADSNSFGLKNCEKHRRSHGPTVDHAELEKLRMINVTMKGELDGLYARDAEHFAEIQSLKARLAQYELPAAMATLAEYNAGDVKALGSPALALTFPWEAT